VAPVMIGVDPHKRSATVESPAEQQMPSGDRGQEFQQGRHGGLVLAADLVETPQNQDNERVLRGEQVVRQAVVETGRLSRP
jgi:hypothetical protein